MNGLLKNIPWRWVLFALLAYLIFLVATFPVTRVVARLQTYNVQMSGVSGSIWHGRAAAVQMRGMTFGPTEWRINALRLFFGKVSIALRAKRDDGFLNTNVDFGLGGAVNLRDVQASLPLAALSGFSVPGGWPNGWHGQLQLRLDTVKLVNRWPSDIDGRVGVLGLTRELPPPPQSLGDHNLVFASGASKDLIGTITSAQDAPLDITGTVQLTANHTCVISLLVKLRANAPAALRQELERSPLEKDQGGWRIPFEFAAASF